MKLLSIFYLLSIILLADSSVVQKAHVLKSDYPNLSTTKLQYEVLQIAKQKASKEIYGEFMACETVMEDGHIIDDVIRLKSGGIVHVRGKPKFSDDEDSMSVIATIYATDKDLDKSYKDISVKLQTRKKDIKKKGFIGDWSGFLISSDGGSSSVDIVITNYANAVIFYKSKKCAGDLIVKEKTSNKVIFKEVLTFGNDRCRVSSKIILRKVTPKSLEFIQELDGKKMLSGRIYLLEQ